MKYYPEVVQALPLADRHIAVCFSDGRITDFDINPLIREGGVFALLGDDSFFTSRLTVMNGTAAWDVTGDRDETCCIDLDPFVLYAAPQMKDPLKRYRT